MKNINKQEELVCALWDFVEELQRNPEKCTVKMINDDGFETKMNMEAINKTINRIAKNFKLEIQEIQ
jgi:hypothetical protein